MFGLDQRTTLLVALAVGLVAWGVYENADVLLGPVKWLRGKLTWATTKTEADPAEAAKKAFAELQSLLVFAKSPAGCAEMVEHLNAAGMCLFAHRHEVHPPAHEVVA
jgi:hypothetical protein